MPIMPEGALGSAGAHPSVFGDRRRSVGLRRQGFFLENNGYDHVARMNWIGGKATELARFYMDRRQKSRLQHLLDKPLTCDRDDGFFRIRHASGSTFQVKPRPS